MDEAPNLEDTSPAPVHVTHNMRWGWPRQGVSNFVVTSSVAAEPYNAANEATPAEESCFTTPAEASPTDEPYIVAPEEDPLPEETLTAGEAFFKEDPMGKEKVAPQATLEASQAEPIIEGFNSAEEHTLNQYEDIPHELDDPYKPTPEPDVAPMHTGPIEDAEFLIPPLRPALCAGRDKSNFDSSSSSAPSSTVTSVLKATAPEALTKNSYIITLKILNGSKVLRSIVFIRAYTRMAILNEVRAYCVKCA